jgi:multidrug resistance efflux pump
MRTILALTLTLATLVASAGAGEPDDRLLRMDDVARGRAGIRTDLALAGDESGAGTAPSLRLTGRAVVPNAAIDVIAAPVAGRVVALQVNAGDRIPAGHVVARLQGAALIDAQREYLAARVAADLARSRAARDEKLAASGLIATNRLDATRAELSLAEGMLASQRQMLRLFGLDGTQIERLRSAADIRPYVELRAPRGGIVLEIDATLAAALEAGAPVLRVAAIGTLWLELAASREQARILAVGDAVRVAGCSAAGRVIAAAAQLAAASQVLVIRASLPAEDGCVLPNQYVEADVAPAAGRAAGLVSLPRAAVISRGKGHHAFVASADGFRVVDVEPVRALGDRQLVRGGVRPGDAVAVSGIAALKGAWLGLGQPADSGVP